MSGAPPSPPPGADPWARSEHHRPLVLNRTEIHVRCARRSEQVCGILAGRSFEEQPLNVICDLLELLLAWAQHQHPDKVFPERQSEARRPVGWGQGRGGGGETPATL